MILKIKMKIERKILEIADVSQRKFIYFCECLGALKI